MKHRLVLALIALLGFVLLGPDAARADMVAPSTAFTYTGTWADGADGEKATEQLNATAKLTFNVTGTDGRVGLSGLKTPWSGKATVQIDSATPVTTGLYASAGPVTAEWYLSPLLAKGTHTVTVKVLHTKTSASTGYWVSIKTARLVRADLGGTPPPPPPPPPPPSTFPACPSTTVTPFPSGTVLNSQYKVGSPGSSTYNLTGVTSTAYPATGSPFAFGTSTPPANFCMKNGIVAGTTDDAKGWSYYHDTWNASCVRIVATSMIQANGLRCHDIEDGLKFLENNNSVGNSNTTTFYSQGVWLDRVRDDCIENDFALGGVLYDSLWERCNTGVSERPASANGTWTSPAGETVTLDHMLIGLWQTWHEADGRSGENALFKWSSSANHLVIKCSIFKVDAVSLNGTDSMAIPAGTVVDDSACPANPSTIVWLGGGSYPGNLNGSGLTVTSDPAVWTNAVSSWKTAHGY